MRYYTYGPVELPRDDGNLLIVDKSDRQAFWEDVESGHEWGLSDACGCYVFALRSGGGVMPWYVGKAERQSFKRECLTQDKVQKYNEVLATLRKGTPVLYFYARATVFRRNFSRPSTRAHRDIDYLEKMLIGLALERNKNLVNLRDTTLLRTMVVPGLLNTPPGSLRTSDIELKGVLGY